MFQTGTSKIGGTWKYIFIAGQSELRKYQYSFLIGLLLHDADNKFPML